MQNLLFRRHLLLPVMALTTLLIPMSAQAQQAQVVTQPQDDKQALSVNTVYVGDGVTVYKRLEDNELKKKISLEADNMPITEAIRRALEGTGITCDIDNDVPTDKTVTVTMKNVPLSLVLTMLTQEAGVNWSFTQKVEGDKKESTVHIGKRRPGISRVISTAGRTPYTSRSMTDPKVQVEIDNALRSTINAARAGNNTFTYSMRALTSARLPDTRVKLDVNNVSIRESLKDVLKQAGVDYALEDDVPDDIKRSFTFENVPISTALDVICRSVDIGWQVERVGEPAPARRGTDEGDKKRKLVIHIGKKYRNRATNVYGLNNLDSFISTLATPVINGLAQPFNNIVVPQVPTDNLIISPPTAPVVEFNEDDDSDDV